LNLAFSFPLALNGLMILTIDLLTEQGPAISLAYELAEAQVMTRPPRNLVTERLVSARSLFYSYIMAGVPNALVCMLAYFMVYIKHGIPVARLAYSLDRGYFAYPPFKQDAAGNWTSGVRIALRSRVLGVARAALALTRAPLRRAQGAVVPILYAEDGTPYDALQQWDIFCQSQAAWYLSLVLCQFWHIWNCRTRTASIFSHGLFSNVVMLYGGVTEIAIMCAVIYVPVFQRMDAFQTRDLLGVYWLPQFAYAGFIFAYNEGVKWAVRAMPRGWVARHLSW
jgi:sodium/potassium-transporting ATPase subunit alpha